MLRQKWVWEFNIAIRQAILWALEITSRTHVNVSFGIFITTTLRQKLCLKWFWNM